ncbi:stAR-related lipid transfer protein 7, mitochondrial-like [Patiria miniata]|uniref:StAR-related lipid transfer protein 7, mitochondrial n=1 Tax=Patiria miniata TaxID=46514 RepID=A0A913Z4P4_PATMI|nr:stAR-related lipid transfer protein 7, mitochondrial-like [Patiria miniata]
MAFQNSLREATRRLLRPHNCSNKLNFAKNAYWRSGSSQRVVLPWRTWVRVTLLRGQSLPECLDTILKLLKRQLHVYASQKLRRMEGVMSLYGYIYAENMLQTLAGNFSRRFVRGRKRPFYFLFGGACFVWDKHNRITDQEMDSCADDFEMVEELERLDNDNQGTTSNAPWDVILKHNHLKVWRRPLDDTYLYEYKAYGCFMDVSAKSFFQVQLDLEYRKVWDQYAIKLDVVDQDDDTGSEVIHWVTHYPFPMYSRDYVFARRFKIDHANNIMTVVSKAVEHPKVPASKTHVRVNSYFSQMVIRPHRSFEENGFDYILTYHDDPQTSFPSPCVNWMTKSGVPDFLEKLHQAAMQYETYNAPHVMIRDLTSAGVDDSQRFTQHSPGQYSM